MPQLWDSFRIQDATRVGWWEDVERGNGTVPVRTNSSDFKVSAFVREGVATMVVIASWSDAAGEAPAAVSLSIAWAALGLSASAAQLRVPAVPPFQLTSGTYSPDHVFLITPSQGGLIAILEKFGA